jgi:hypothetical protein
MSDISDPVDGPPYIAGATSEELPGDMTDVSHVVAYELRPEEQPGGPDGLKVRYEVSVVTGETARELDAAQAEVIWELLKWARDYRSESKKGQENAHGTTGKDD